MPSENGSVSGQSLLNQYSAAMKQRDEWKSRYESLQAENSKVHKALNIVKAPTRDDDDVLLSIDERVYALASNLGVASQSQEQIDTSLSQDERGVRKLRRTLKKLSETLCTNDLDTLGMTPQDAAEYLIKDHTETSTLYNLARKEIDDIRPVMTKLRGMGLTPELATTCIGKLAEVENKLRTLHEITRVVDKYIDPAFVKRGDTVSAQSGVAWLDRELNNVSTLREGIGVLELSRVRLRFLECCRDCGLRPVADSVMVMHAGYKKWMEDQKNPDIKRLQAIEETLASACKLVDPAVPYSDELIQSGEFRNILIDKLQNAGAWERIYGICIRYGFNDALHMEPPIGGNTRQNQIQHWTVRELNTLASMRRSAKDYLDYTSVFPQIKQVCYEHGMRLARDTELSVGLEGSAMVKWLTEELDSLAVVRRSAKAHVAKRNADIVAELNQVMADFMKAPIINSIGPWLSAELRNSRAYRMFCEACETYKDSMYSSYGASVGDPNDDIERDERHEWFIGRMELLKRLEEDKALQISNQDDLASQQ